MADLPDPRLPSGRSSLVQFVGASPEPRLLKDFVGIAVGFCPLSQERERQLLRFNKAGGEFV
jgi:hypothetical protein